jgi:DNA-binding HxlR family transcriptional regulator
VYAEAPSHSQCDDENEDGVARSGHTADLTLKTVADPLPLQRMLTKQLKELEGDGLISRQVYAEVPPKVEYALTTKGKALRPILLALEKWGTQNALPKATTQGSKA